MLYSRLSIGLAEMKLQPGPLTDNPEVLVNGLTIGTRLEKDGITWCQIRLSFLIGKRYLKRPH
jgi:hypothetical protein